MDFSGQLFPSSYLGIGEQSTLIVVTDPIAPGDEVDVQLKTPRVYTLTSLSCSSPCWVRVYGSYYGRELDNRSEPGSPFPPSGSGFYAEVLATEGNLNNYFSPILDIRSETTDTFFRVRNDSPFPESVTLTLEVVTSVYDLAPSPPPYNCNPYVNTQGQTNLDEAWLGCSSISHLAPLDLSICTSLVSAWEDCTSLQFVPPEFFSNCPATDLSNAFVNCSLSTQSVDNILISLDEAGEEDGLLDITGGANNPPSGAGLLAKSNLESKGWTVNLEPGVGPVLSSVDMGETIYSLATFEDGRVYAGSDSGKIYISSNYGLTFDAGTLVGDGRIYSLAACQGDTLLAGTWADSFPFISNDGGETWVAGEDFNQSEIDSILHAGGGVVYIGTYGYINKSVDNGVTWLPSVEPDPAADYYVSLAISGPNSIIAGTYSDGYLSYSSDGGATWSSTPQNILDGLAESIYALASNGDGIVIAGTDGDGRIFRSSNYGATWNNGTQLGEATEVYRAVCTSEGHFYAGTNDDGKIYRSLDGALTWELFFDPGLIGGYVYSLLDSGSGTLIAGIDSYVYSIPLTPAPAPEESIQIYPVVPDTGKFVESDPGIVGAGAIKVSNIVSITQGGYDSLVVKDPETVYIIIPTCDSPPYGCNTNVNPYCVTDFSSAWDGCTGLTSFPLLNVSSGVNFTYAWYNCYSLTDFPLLDFSSATSLSNAWYQCSSLTSFPLINSSSVTDFSYAWQGCLGLTSFPALDVSSGVNFHSAWKICVNLTSFPLLDVSSGSDFRFTWAECTNLTVFPALNLSSGTTFLKSWYDCTNLASFPAGMFDSCVATDFTFAWQYCALTEESVDNILVSLDTAGQSNGTVNLDGGTSSAPGVAGLAAKSSLEGKGWTVVTN